MQITTVVWILVAVVFSLLVVLFQNYYKTKRRGKLIVLLSFLRFLGIFGILLLLINPKITKTTYDLEKANLVVLIDNSASIKNSKSISSVHKIVESFTNDKELKDRFKVTPYSFGTELNAVSDSLSFNEKNTNIGAALQSIEEIYRNNNTAILLVSDGNQTLGQDYEFFGTTSKKTIYPVVIGDTTSYEDLKITQVNKNNYAFLKNKYPLEVYVSYSGDKAVAKVFTISENGKNVYRENLTFSKNENSKVVTTNIDAKTIGIKKITTTIGSLPNEKNIVNNTKTVAIEVIDEKTNIAIISAIEHPDLGALKKAIESNEQRSVTILKPTATNNDWQNIDLFIFYQPTENFKNVFGYAAKSNRNSLIISGLQTDWNFLNKVQNTYVFENGYPVQELIPVLNASFSKFDVSEFSINDFPPLRSNVSPLFPKSLNQTILKTKIRGVSIETPLLSVNEGKNNKQAFLFGEDIWKWRMQTYRNEKDFKTFDDFIGKLVLYLSSNKPKNRFILDYKQIYLGSNEAVIRASVFDETFEFDTNASVTLKIQNKEKTIRKTVPMLLNQLNYIADLSDLPSGDYNFIATVTGINSSKSGTFTILDYDVEQQFSSSNYKKLNSLAKNTNGALFFTANLEGLKQQLLSKEEYKPVQKSKENIVSLVEFKFLLGFILLAFAAEWFLRKYNGLT
ncbi:VWA domain-containing protein [Cellulophaga sp. 20_2_10]|uniref:vWA domain-containing protein n=1 Tax=Cellulophaga sp. 20_2_10 TaxID=2942476 RepID=UPI00201AD7B0|nr:vWA domain-containing protein [Cellulophaga sp. 20_2_10]MCL5244382.1 VWA domain-containing protein [Cellulophaga sp. 20_2_10]